MTFWAYLFFLPTGFVNGAFSTNVSRVYRAAEIHTYIFTLVGGGSDKKDFNARLRIGAYIHTYYKLFSSANLFNNR